MLGTAVILLFISAATCSRTIRNYIPLSAPLPNGTMVLQCPPKLSSFDRCVGTRGCCSNEIQRGAIELCGTPYTEDLEWATVQHHLNIQTALCHFDGRSADNVQLLLTPDASAILDSLNRQDEELRRQQAIYIALQIIGGHIGLPILLLISIFSKTAHRDLTFLNFCFTWIFSSVTFSVGLYRLGPATLYFQATLPFIHSNQECLTQAALVSGAQAMTDTAMCALIVQLWFDFRAAIHGPRSPRQIRWTRATLLAAPYVTLLAFSLPALSATVNPVKRLGSGGLVASPTSFYCMLFDKPTFPGPISQHTFLISQYTVLLSILIVTLIFDASIIHILYRRWRFFQRTGEKALGVPISVAVRVVIFCAYRVVVAVAYVSTMLNTQGSDVSIGVPVPGGPAIMEIGTSFIPVWEDMLQAGTPLVAVLIFGTSKAFLDALMFWKRFSPILNTLMFRHRRSPGTQSAYNAHGEVFDVERLVSGDSVLDIGPETKGTDGYR